MDNLQTAQEMEDGSMNPVFEQMSRIGIVPVIALDDAGDAAPLAEALLKGGISCAEVTFRTAAAEETNAPA